MAPSSFWEVWKESSFLSCVPSNLRRTASGDPGIGKSTLALQAAQVSA